MLVEPGWHTSLVVVTPDTEIRIAIIDPTRRRSAATLPRNDQVGRSPDTR